MQMKDRSQDRASSRIAEVFKFSRMDLAVLPFIFAGLAAAFITAMGTMAMGYDSRAKDIHVLLSYAALLLFFPAFLIALLRRRWATLPLWLCCVALLANGLAHPKEMITASSLKSELERLGIVLLTEIARFIRGAEPEKLH